MLLCPASAIQSINCCQCGRNHRVAVRTHLRHVRVRHRAGARHWRPNPRPRGWLEHTASAAPLPAKGHLAIFTEVHPESTGQLGGGSAGDCSAATAAVSNAEAGRARQNPRASRRERKLELSRRSRQHTLQQSDDSGDVAKRWPSPRDKPQQLWPNARTSLIRKDKKIIKKGILTIANTKR